MNTQNLVLSSIIGINPTGIMTYDGSLKLNGNNNIVNSSNTVNKKSIERIQNNQILCDDIEKFENFSKSSNNSLNNIIYILLIMIIILFIFYILYFK
jgi:hypothetical protein